MPANLAQTAGLVAEDCPEGYARHSPPPRFLYVWQEKGLAARCLYVWQGKELFAQKWCKIRGYSDVWQRQDLALVTGDSKTQSRHQLLWTSHHATGDRRYRC
jgi:hypothetical protein